MSVAAFGHSGCPKLETLNVSTFGPTPANLTDKTCSFEFQTARRKSRLWEKSEFIDFRKGLKLEALIASTSTFREARNLKH